MRALMIGERVTRFWFGSKFVFKRVGRGEWECIEQDGIIPAGLWADLGE